MRSISHTRIGGSWRRANRQVHKRCGPIESDGQSLVTPRAWKSGAMPQPTGSRVSALCLRTSSIVSLALFHRFCPRELRCPVCLPGSVIKRKGLLPARVISILNHPRVTDLDRPPVIHIFAVELTQRTVEATKKRRVQLALFG